MLNSVSKWKYNLPTESSNSGTTRPYFNSCCQICINVVVSPFWSVLPQKPKQDPRRNVLKLQKSKKQKNKKNCLTNIYWSITKKSGAGTCKSMEAFAHKTTLLTGAKPLENVRFKPISLSGEEFTVIVTSSMLSPITDHPSSVKPLTASLKPL